MFCLKSAKFQSFKDEVAKCVCQVCDLCMSVHDLMEYMYYVDLWICTLFGNFHVAIDHNCQRCVRMVDLVSPVAAMVRCGKPNRLSQCRSRSTKHQPLSGLGLLKVH